MQLSLATSALRTNAVACRTSKPARRSLCVVRASVETEEKPAEAQAAPSTSQPSAPPSLVRPHKALTKSTLPDVMDVMSFNGSAPEIINGRLAMLGFVAAFGAEVFTGKTALQQVSGHGGAIFLTFLLFSLASLAPIVRGVRNDEAFGPLTPSVELLNGRAAMVGFGSLLLLEAVRGSALF